MVSQSRLRLFWFSISRLARHSLYPLVAALFVVALPQPSFSSEPGAVLIVGADRTDAGWGVTSFGSGTIVKLDAGDRTGYVLTTRHVAHSADRLYVLCDPMVFLLDSLFVIEDGAVPSDVATALVTSGNAVPVKVRSGLPPDTLGEVEDDLLYFPMESWVLSGEGHEYLAVPETEHVTLYHILPADIIRETGVSLDLALLAVRNVPMFDTNPVVYMLTEVPVPRGAAVRTLGCQCGLREGITRAEVAGSVVSTGSGFITYQSPLAHHAFTGGPVFLDGHMIAINSCEDLRPGYPIRARLTSTFKQLVDVWIDLPSMRVDLTVDSPDGARDGVVSTGQVFTVEARVVLDPDGHVLAPRVTLRLELPESYSTETERIRTLSVGDEATWIVSAPGHTTERAPIRLSDEKPALGLPPTSIAEVTIRTEEGSHLVCTIVEGPPHGAKLFTGEEFTVGIQFIQSGRPVGEIDGSVSMGASAAHLESLDGIRSQRIETGQPLRWRLRTIQAGREVPLSFTADVRTVDGNDKVIDVKLPDTILVSIKPDPGFRFRLGLGAMLSEEDIGAELSLGFQYRLMNIMQRGMPLLLGAVVGAGVDHAAFEEVGVLGHAVDVRVVDYRYSAGVTLAVGIGTTEIGLEVGEARFRTWLDTDDAYASHLRKEPQSSLYIQPSIEVRLGDDVSLLGGARRFRDLDTGEYFLQLVLR